MYQVPVLRELCEVKAHLQHRLNHLFMAFLSHKSTPNTPPDLRPRAVEDEDKLGLLAGPLDKALLHQLHQHRGEGGEVHQQALVARI